MRSLAEMEKSLQELDEKSREDGEESSGGR